MSAMATKTNTGEVTLPRRLKCSMSNVHKALNAGPDVFFASRRAGVEESRKCLSSLFFLASSLHTARLMYYSKSLETSLARHVTVEQIWGQMNMLLRPVFRRLQDNVRRLQKSVNNTISSSSSQKNGKAGGQSQVKRPRDDDDCSGEAEKTDVLKLDDSDLDEDIAHLLAGNRRVKMTRGDKDNHSSRADDTWRYPFGKADGDGDIDEWGDEKEENEEEGVSGSEDDGDARIRRRHARAMSAADDGDASGEEELAALKEMYGEDFEPEDDYDDGAVDPDDDPGLEEDLFWDDPSATFGERDGDYIGNNDTFDNGQGTQEEYQSKNGSGDIDGVNSFDNDDDDAELNNPNLTELQRERLRERRLVARLEQERLYSTQWAMTGEVSANNRPRDALLDEELEFEHAMKAVPIITEATTANLEDRIRRRIIDANYDDVQRRTAMSTTGDLVTTRRDATIDSEKSKFSLVDLYEKEYLDRMRAAEEASSDAAQTAEPLTEIEKDELRAIHMWRRLAQHLDALSNFYYTPKPVHEEFSARVRAVENQAPAIALETVGNFATTREDALAPQDLHRAANRKYADVGSNELVPRERRALRRAKKVLVAASNDRKTKRAAQAKAMRQQQKKPK